MRVVEHASAAGPSLLHSCRPRGIPAGRRRQTRNGPAHSVSGYEKEDGVGAGRALYVLCANQSGLLITFRAGKVFTVEKYAVAACPAEPVSVHLPGADSERGNRRTGDIEHDTEHGMEHTIRASTHVSAGRHPSRQFDKMRSPVRREGYRESRGKARVLSAASAHRLDLRCSKVSRERERERSSTHTHAHSLYPVRTQKRFPFYSSFPLRGRFSFVLFFIFTFYLSHIFFSPFLLEPASNGSAFSREPVDRRLRFYFIFHGEIDSVLCTLLI